MTAKVAHLSAALRDVDRPADGQRLAGVVGHINGAPFEVTLTASELHFGFPDRAGPSFAVNLNELAQTATDQIEMLITGKRPML